VPFLRPVEFSGNLSPDFPVFLHALEWLWEHEKYRPDIVVHLRPTSPIRKIEELDEAIMKLIDDPTLDSVRSVQPMEEIVQRTWTVDKEGMLHPAFVIPPCCSPDDPGFPGNSPRQHLPAGFSQNCNIDVARTSTILEKRSMTGTKIAALIQEKVVDVDTEEDWLQAVDHMSKVELTNM